MHIKAGPIKGCPTPVACVEHCPQKTFHYEAEKRLPPKLLLEKMAPFCSADISHLINDNVTDNVVADLVERNKTCPQHWFPSTSIFHRCIPNIFPNPSSPERRTIKEEYETYKNYVFSLYDSEVGDGRDILPDTFDVQNITKSIVDAFREISFVNKAMMDVERNWEVILGLMFPAILICLLWIWLFRYFAFPLVWGTLIAIAGLLCTAAILCFLRYDSLMPDGTCKFIYYLKFFLTQKAFRFRVGLARARVHCTRRIRKFHCMGQSHENFKSLFIFCRCLYFITLH